MRKYILLFVTLISAFMIDNIAHSAPRPGPSCADKLQIGQAYDDVHSGPTLTWYGSFTLQKVYACEGKVCFVASMSFDNYNGGDNLAVGEMSGQTLRFRRFVDSGSFTQEWVGRCDFRGVDGHWVNETQASDHGEFQILY